jgi:TRAP transporter TAXI family solute receptor
MAGLISHPLGVGRCDTATVCGPAGVILSARTSEGSTDNLRSVNQGLVDSGFADGDAIAAAVAGQGGAFRRPARHLRVIAALFPEEAHLVAAAKSDIQSVADLRGRRVLMGLPNSASLLRARAIMTAYRIRVREVVSDETGAQMLKNGKIDAYFAVAGVPLDSIRDLLAQHVARLVPIDGEGRDRLIAMVPQLSATTIQAGVYPETGPVESVATRAYWVTSDSEPDALIYGITRALFNPANRGPLAASHPSAREIGLSVASANPPAPLHPGAARFYRELEKLAD